MKKKKVSRLGIIASYIFILMLIVALPLSAARAQGVIPYYNPFIAPPPLFVSPFALPFALASFPRIANVPVAPAPAPAVAPPVVTAAGLTITALIPTALTPTIAPAITIVLNLTVPAPTPILPGLTTALLLLGGGGGGGGALFPTAPLPLLTLPALTPPTATPITTIPTIGAILAPVAPAATPLTIPLI